MLPNHHHTLQAAYHSSQAALLVPLPIDQASPAGYPGVPSILHPTQPTLQAAAPIPLSTNNAYPVVYPGAYPYYTTFNNNWGPEQERLFLQHTTQMSGEPGPAVPTSTHYRCLCVTDGVVCSHFCIDFDELMLHLGHLHDIQGTAARKIDCQWLTESGICGKKYRRDGFRRHIGTHIGLSVVCNQCGKSFSREDTLRAHVKKSH